MPVEQELKGLLVPAPVSKDQGFVLGLHLQVNCPKGTSSLSITDSRALGTPDSEFLGGGRFSESPTRWKW